MADPRTLGIAGLLFKGGGSIQLNAEADRARIRGDMAAYRRLREAARILEAREKGHGEKRDALAPPGASRASSPLDSDPALAREPNLPKPRPPAQERAALDSDPGLMRELDQRQLLRDAARAPIPVAKQDALGVRGAAQPQSRYVRPPQPTIGPDVSKRKVDPTTLGMQAQSATNKAAQLMAGNPAPGSKLWAEADRLNKFAARLGADALAQQLMTPGAEFGSAFATGGLYSPSAGGGAQIAKRIGSGEAVGREEYEEVYGPLATELGDLEEPRLLGEENNQLKLMGSMLAGAILSPVTYTGLGAERAALKPLVRGLVRGGGKVGALAKATAQGKTVPARMLREALEYQAPGAAISASQAVQAEQPVLPAVGMGLAAGAVLGPAFPLAGAAIRKGLVGPIDRGLGKLSAYAQTKAVRDVERRKLEDIRRQGNPLEVLALREREPRTPGDDARALARKEDPLSAELDAPPVARVRPSYWANRSGIGGVTRGAQRFGAIGEQPRAEPPDPLELTPERLPKLARRLSERTAQGKGFTLDPHTGFYKEDGYAVGMGRKFGKIIINKGLDLKPETIQEFLEANRHLFREHRDLKIGSWIEDGNVHLEPSRVFQGRHQALKVAREYGEEAIGQLSKYARGLDGTIRLDSKPDLIPERYESLSPYAEEWKKLDPEHRAPERVIGAVSATPDGPVSYYKLGAWHGATEPQLQAQFKGLKHEDVENGFMTSYERFIDRDEAEEMFARRTAEGMGLKGGDVLRNNTPPPPDWDKGPNRLGAVGDIGKLKAQRTPQEVAEQIKRVDDVVEQTRAEFAADPTPTPELIEAPITAAKGPAAAKLSAKQIKAAAEAEVDRVFRQLSAKQIDLTGAPMEAQIEAVTRQALKDLQETLLKDPDAAQWYGEKIKGMERAIETIIPETKRRDNMILFKLVLAITSVGQKPQPNLNLAVYIFENYLKGGRLSQFQAGATGSEKTKSKSTRWLGTRGDEMPGHSYADTQYEGALRKVEAYLNKAGDSPEAREEALTRLFTERVEIRYKDKLTKRVWVEDAPLLVTMFGRWPKVGRFNANLNGLFRDITMDVWGTRGTRNKIGDARRGLSKGAPTPREEVVYRESMKEVARLLTEQMGFEVEPSALQGVDWYLIKRLYESLGAPPSGTTDYQQAAESFLADRISGQELIDRAARLKAAAQKRARDERKRLRLADAAGGGQAAGGGKAGGDDRAVRPGKKAGRDVVGGGRAGPPAPDGGIETAGAQLRGMIGQPALGAGIGAGLGDEETSIEDRLALGAAMGMGTLAGSRGVKAFYSRLTKAIQDAPFAKATAQQWSALLAKTTAKGERQWSGDLDKWLGSRKPDEVITREQLLEARGQELGLKETKRGTNPLQNGVGEVDLQNDLARWERTATSAESELWREGASARDMLVLAREDLRTGDWMQELDLLKKTEDRGRMVNLIEEYINADQTVKKLTLQAEVASGGVHALDPRSRDVLSTQLRQLRSRTREAEQANMTQSWARNHGVGAGNLDAIPPHMEELIEYARTLPAIEGPTQRQRNKLYGMIQDDPVFQEILGRVPGGKDIAPKRQLAEYVLDTREIDEITARLRAMDEEGDPESPPEYSAEPDYQGSRTEDPGEGYQEITIQLDRSAAGKGPAMSRTQIEERLGAIEHLLRVNNREFVRPEVAESQSPEAMARLAELTEEREALKGEHARLTESLKTGKSSHREFTSSHWPEKDIAVHIRNDFRPIQGKPSLFIEEIQSDWHQQGRKYGYEGEWRVEYAAKKKDKTGREVGEERLTHRSFGTDSEAYAFADKLGKRKYEDGTPVGDDYTANPLDAASRPTTPGTEAKVRHIQPGTSSQSVPDAPYKSTDEWVGLAVRRVVQEAVEKDVRRISWTTGAEQVQRNLLFETLNALDYKRNDDGSWELRGYRKVEDGGYGEDEGGDFELSHSGSGIPDDKLDAHVGSEVARMLRAAVEKPKDRASSERARRARGNESPENPGFNRLDKLDAEVRSDHGAGTSYFYDEMIPKVFRELAKKLGVKLDVVRPPPRETGIPKTEKTFARRMQEMGPKEGNSYEVRDIIWDEINNVTAGQLRISTYEGMRAKLIKRIEDQIEESERTSHTEAARKTRKKLKEYLEKIKEDHVEVVQDNAYVDLPPEMVAKVKREGLWLYSGLDPKLVAAAFGDATAPAVGGALAGAAQDPEDRLRGAAVGAGVGLGLGGAVRGIRGLAKGGAPRAGSAGPRGPLREGIGTPYTPDPDQAINFKKFAQDLDPEGAQALKDAVDRLITSGQATKKRVTWAETRAVAEQLGLDPYKIIARDRGLTGAEMLALRDVISQGVDRISAASRQISDTRTAHETAVELQGEISSIMHRNELLLKRFIKERSLPGRDLNNLKIIARKDMNPAVWVAQAQRMRGELPLTQDEILKVRELAKARNRDALVGYVSGLRRSSDLDKALTLWKAGLLTGLKTSVVNLTGNTSMMALETAKEPLAVVIDMIIAAVRSEDRHFETGAKRGLQQYRTKELSAQSLIIEQGRGLGRGAKEAMKVFRTGMTPEDLEKWDVRKVNFDSPILQAYTDIVFRNLSAQDQLFRGAALGRSLTENIRVELKRQGLKPGTAAWETEFSKLQLKPTNEIATRAAWDASLATFTNDNPLAKYLSSYPKHTERSPFIRAGLALTIPFVRTPANIAARLADYTPFGLFSTLAKQISDPSQKKLAEGLSRAMTGSALLWFGAQLYREGKATGAMPTDEGERAIWEELGKQANAVLINGKWIQLGRIAPLGMLVSLGAQLATMAETMDTRAQVAVGSIGAGGRLISDQSFVRGVSSAITALNEPERKGDAYVNTLVGSAVPAIVGHLARGLDKQERQPSGPKEALFARVPGLRERTPARVLPSGRIARNRQGLLGSMIDPFNTQPAVETPLLAEMERLGLEPRLPSSSIRDASRKKGQRPRTKEERRSWLLDAGPEIQSALDTLIRHPDYQELEDKYRKDLFSRLGNKLAEEGYLRERQAAGTAGPRTRPAGAVEDVIGDVASEWFSEYQQGMVGEGYRSTGMEDPRDLKRVYSKRIHDALDAKDPKGALIAYQEARSKKVNVDAAANERMRRMLAIQMLLLNQDRPTPQPASRP